MKILMLTTNSSLMDGINRHILAISSEINNLQNYEVAVCTVFPNAELHEALNLLGVKNYSLNSNSGHDIGIFYRFMKVMNDFKPDIIHAHVMAIYERIVLSVFFRDIKYVLTIHGLLDVVEHKTIRMRIENMITNLFPVRFSATCTVSNGVRQQLFGNTDERVYTVYNPIFFPEEIKKTHSLHKLLNVSYDTPLIGTACRLAPVKNPYAFTEIMCKVLRAGDNVHAVVMGDGDSSLSNSLHDIVNKYGVQDRFHWLGYRQDAPELIKDLNCFVLTSFSEGMPTSLLEAMASKVPFAMFEGKGGLIDIADLNKEKKIGIIVQDGNLDKISEEICKLLDDLNIQDALTNNAYNIGKKYFNIKSVCSTLCQIYNTVCGQ